ncbi:Quinoprotein alcohol dehydrogenase-like superfamily [Sesbania bispinosa]|nr:Quinoprotein alcohol dehydrogenase-like superfamily [Sesbania bispinosa]
MPPPKYSIVLCLLLFSIHLVTVIFAASSEWLGQNWLNHGGDLFNRRYAYKESKDITATAAIYDDTLYFPSWNGNIYAVRKGDGSLVWKQNLEKLTGLNATGFILNVNWTVSRSTPTVAEDLVIIGIYGPAIVIGLNRTNGELVWLTRLDNHPAAVVTMSGTYYNGGYYVGTSSLEEGATIAQCCIFRGSLVKIDARTGAILWKTYMLPDNNGERGGYAGAGIWGSSPSIDIYRNHVYIATGNLYSAPSHILQCQERQENQTTPTQPDECIEPDNHSNSILALDLGSGNITWYRQLGGYDVWFFACNNASTSNCPPQGPTPDADFGEAPMMLTSYVNGTKKDIVVAVQKSGFAWALDRNNGNLVWFTEVGPGGLAGGGTWGAATDERRVYTNIANSGAKNFTLTPSNTITTGGGWVAMNSSNRKILWSIANPSNTTASGPVSVANDVVFAGSTDRMGSIYAINGNNGKILWSYEIGASVYGGMSVSNGCIYIGNGYNVNLGFPLNLTAGTSLFAFCV